MNKKKKSFSLKTSSTLLAVLLAISIGACGTENNTDTIVTNNTSEAEETVSPNVTVTFKDSLDETKADDGKVIHTSSKQMPVVNIEGAKDIAEKINADIASYYDTFSPDETISMAKEDYAASLGEDGWDFHGYSTYSDRLKTIREKMEGFGMTKDEEEELRKLEEIIGKSIMYSLPPLGLDRQILHI